MRIFCAACCVAATLVLGSCGGDAVERANTPQPGSVAGTPLAATVTPNVFAAPVARLYVAMFGRAPDAGGLNYWEGLLGAGQTIASVADQMYGVAPARAYFPAGIDNNQVVTSFYTNVLGRAPDSAGLAYWLAKLNAAGATPGSVIAELVSVVASYNGTDPAGQKSAALFNNRAAVALFYAEHGGNIASASSAIAGVSDDPATVATAENLVLASLPRALFNPFQASLDRKKSGDSTPVVIGPAVDRVPGVDPFKSLAGAGSSN